MKKLMKDITMPHLKIFVIVDEKLMKKMTIPHLDSDAAIELKLTLP